MLSLSHSHRLLTHFLPLPSLSPSSRHCLSSLPLSSHSLRSPLRARGLSDLSDAPSPPESIQEGGESSGGGGPIEIEVSPFSSTPLFASDDSPSPLQVATSVLLTGAISVFLFRSLRRRARRAKELRLRSSGAAKPKDLKEEALDSLKAMGVAPVEAGAPPSPVQALLGAIAAGAIALILYKFTVTIEAALNRQAISDNFSARQITITIRTIVNGLCYLATFVFGINSVGLLLYSVQLAFSSFMESPTGSSMPSKEVGGQLNMADPTKSSKKGAESKNSDMQGSSDDS